MTDLAGETMDSVQEDIPTMNKILVKNFHSAIDENMLEAFFESRKTGGGGQVKNVQLNRKKNWAVIDFCEAEAVDCVLSKVPITMMGTELEIRPYIPLVQPEELFESLEIRSLPKELTDDLLTMHIEGTLEATEMSSAEYKSDEGEELGDGDLAVTQLTSTRPKAEGIVKETVACLQPVQLRILQMTNYTEAVLEQLPDIKVKIDLEHNEISFMGDVETVLSGYRNLMEALSKFSVNRIYKKPAEHIKIYKRERVIEHINTILEEQSIVCAWEVIEQVIVICSLHEDNADCTKLIDKKVSGIEFPVCKESSATFMTREWQEEVKLIQAENDVVHYVYSDKTSTNVNVIAIDKEVRGIVCRIKTFLKSQVDLRSEACDIPNKFKNIYDLHSKLALKMLDLTVARLSLYHVTVKRVLVPAYNSYYEIKITGTREGIELAKQHIAELDTLF